MIVQVTDCPEYDWVNYRFTKSNTRIDEDYPYISYFETEECTLVFEGTKILEIKLDRIPLKVFSTLRLNFEQLRSIYPPIGV